jgi:hypothetical protein
LCARISFYIRKAFKMAKEETGKPEETPGQGPPDNPGDRGKPPHNPPGPVDPPIPPKKRRVG